jgi:hypothetical protein
MTNHPSAQDRLSFVLRSLFRPRRRGTALLCSALMLPVVCFTSTLGATDSRTGAPGSWSPLGSEIRPSETAGPEVTSAAVERRDRLEGLIHEYSLAA